MRRSSPQAPHSAARLCNTGHVDHDRADADRFLKQLHPGFDVRFNPEGTLAQRFKVSGMPTSLIIDRHGVVRFTHVGFWPADSVVAAHEIRELLAEKP